MLTNSANDESLSTKMDQMEEAVRAVKVERPFMLTSRLVLREYQHFGLSWLVSLHERRLNGILADEMGLGKTIQTIALLAYLACYRGIWGPHLIVVPSSCVVNWESEFKRWCPGFKVLTYYGSAKARKNLRVGWSKMNSFHVCITSYQLVVQDSSAFRRKQWYYLILDEAHNIKNFKSQRWQTLLNYNSQRRLLLTGTPLQNNLMELWSLMHFLMPHIFRSRKEFSYWFSNPLASMVEGTKSVNNELIGRLHSIMRPFLLRRLKKDVEKQMPGKFEHIVNCKLSKRQLHLYEEFMSRTSTKASLNGSNYLGMMNILMQLRKVCNHPDLFEPRPIESPFLFESLVYTPPRICLSVTRKSPLDGITTEKYIDLWSNIPMSASQVSLETYLQLINNTEGLIATDGSLKNKVKYAGYVNELLNLRRNWRKERNEYNYNLSEWRNIRPTIHCTTPRLIQLSSLNYCETVVQSRSNQLLAIQEVTPCWYDLIPSVNDRAKQLKSTIEQFVMVLPKVTLSKSSIQLITVDAQYQLEMKARDTVYRKMKPMYQEHVAPFYPAAIRQTIIFPDRKLVQFDAGKLQRLDTLLRDLKKGEHKCLIFTQMSKMLDILESFLNLHGHTYLRLDGSTSLDKRQKLMDRFNSDHRIFCFILSTRSGGLGINLTGADSVIFYDSDWNPAMDAQAQDRAHRIGQTRNVHIYRFVCSSTIEENILIKARQKRHLDHLVMTEGNFSESSLFSAEGLKNIFGVADTASTASGVSGGVGSSAVGKLPSSKSIAEAMMAVEDEDDVNACKGLSEEISKDQNEFDESVAVVPSTNLEDEDGALPSENGATTPSLPAPNTEEEDAEKEFNNWQASVGPDFTALQSALKPIERYALHIRTDVEPFYSLHFLSEQQKLEAMAQSNESAGNEWDVEAIERDKEVEENRLLAEGELLSTGFTTGRSGKKRSREVIRLHNWFIKERNNKKQERRKRILTGEGWIHVTTDLTQPAYWFNNDTGEACYTKPLIIERKDEITEARRLKYNAFPVHLLIHIMSYLLPYPDRLNARVACKRWFYAANSPIFKFKVFAIETGVRDSVERKARMQANEFVSLQAAIQASQPGQEIVLGNGHHWEEHLAISHPLKISSEVCDATKCIVELTTGSVEIQSTAQSVMFRGITIRRPRKIINASHGIHVDSSKCAMYSCIVDNDQSNQCAIYATGNSSLLLLQSKVTGGTNAGICVIGSTLCAANCSIIRNNGYGILSLASHCNLNQCTLQFNSKQGLSALSNSNVIINQCEFNGNSSLLSPNTIMNNNSPNIGYSIVKTENQTLNMGNVIMDDDCVMETNDSIGLFV